MYTSGGKTAKLKVYWARSKFNGTAFFPLMLTGPEANFMALLTQGIFNFISNAPCFGLTL